MIITTNMNLTDNQLRAVLSTAQEQGMTADELLKSLVDQRFPDKPVITKEQKWEKLMHAVNGFTEDCFENFEQERKNEFQQEREKL